MIDWNEQWATFAPGFFDGKAHIELPSGEVIELLPGAGFGDYSHPTTKLMVSLMASYIPHQIVLDIGCGSGILSVAAAKMGAKKVFACDIDPEALVHAKQNGHLNGIDIDTAPTLSFSNKPVVLMNMISSEQELAWNNWGCQFDTLITSGILTSAKESYLKFAKANGWKLIEEQESEGWLGFTFKEIDYQ